MHQDRFQNNVINGYFKEEKIIKQTLTCKTDGVSSKVTSST